MEKEIKVSIIVPAYNVERYIKKCISSILSQTYENIEIIVVNDGSTDNTKTILNEFKDKRIVFIDKENSGVSAARNSGLDIATGQYVVFVDGDDYLAPDYIEYMIGLTKVTNAEFCLSKNCYSQQGEQQVKMQDIKVLSPADASALLLSPRVIVGCWNKIYSKVFIDGNKLRFSQTLFYGEGLSFIITCAQLAKRVGVGNRKVYYYRRNNEASATTKFDIRKYRNGEKALIKIQESMSIRNENTDTMYYLHMGLFSMGAMVRIKANHRENEYSKEYQHWKKTTKYYTKKIITKKGVSVYRKLMLIGGSISPWIMMELDRVRRKQISNNSVRD